MTVANYESSSEHFRRFGSKLPEAEKKKYDLFIAKESAFLKARLDLLGDSLSGLITQQEAVRQFRAGLTLTQKRDIIYLETHKDTGLLPNYTRHQEKKTALKLHSDKSMIETRAHADEFSALKLLDMEEAIKKEMNLKEDEKKATANKDVQNAIEKEIAELKAFLAQLPQMREAIQEFVEQQIRQRLSTASLARAALEDTAPLGSSVDGKMNEGYALTEKEKKNADTTTFRVSGRFSSGTVAVSEEKKYNEQGEKEVSYSIPSKCFKRNKYGMPGYDYLYHEGREDLAKHIHERLIDEMKDSFGIDFSEVDMKDIGWFMQYLQNSIEVSLANARKQSDLSNIDPNSPPFSAHVIMHDAAIASLDKLAETNSMFAWACKKDILALKRLNNTCNIEKAKLLIRETTYARQNAVIHNPSSAIVATKNLTTALQVLTVAARNEIALTLRDRNRINIGDDIDATAKAWVALRKTENTIKAEYEKALAGSQQAQVKLDQLKAAERQPGAQKTKAVADLETQVKKLKKEVKELAFALKKLNDVTQNFQETFDGTNSVDKINPKDLAALVSGLTLVEKNAIIDSVNAVRLQFTTPPAALRTASSLADLNDPIQAERIFAVALADGAPPNNLRQAVRQIYSARMAVTPMSQDKVAAIAAIAPVVAMDADSALAIATIMVDGRRPPPTSEERDSAIEAQRVRVINPAWTIATINEAFNVNANDTMTVLNAVYRLVKDPAGDPARIAAMVAAVPAELERLVKAFPIHFAGIVFNNLDRRRELINAHPGSFADITRRNALQLENIVRVDIKRYTDIVRRNAVRLENIVRVDIKRYVDIARQNGDRLAQIVRVDIKRYVDIARRSPERFKAIVQADIKRYVDIAHRNPERFQAIVQADIKRYVDIARQTPAQLKIIVHSCPRLFAGLMLQEETRKKIILKEIIKKRPDFFVHLISDIEDVKTIIKDRIDLFSDLFVEHYPEQVEQLASILAKYDVESNEDYDAEDKFNQMYYANALERARAEILDDPVGAIARAKVIPGQEAIVEALVVDTISQHPNKTALIVRFAEAAKKSTDTLTLDKLVEVASDPQNSAEVTKSIARAATGNEGAAVREIMAEKVANFTVDSRMNNALNNCITEGIEDSEAGVVVKAAVVTSAVEYNNGPNHHAELKNLIEAGLDDVAHKGAITDIVVAEVGALNTDVANHAELDRLIMEGSRDEAKLADGTTIGAAVTGHVVAGVADFNVVAENHVELNRVITEGLADATVGTAVTGHVVASVADFNAVAENHVELNRVITEGLADATVGTAVTGHVVAGVADYNAVAENHVELNRVITEGAAPDAVNHVGVKRCMFEAFSAHVNPAERNQATVNAVNASSNALAVMNSAVNKAAVDVRQNAVTAAITAHRADFLVQDVINNSLAIADPLVIASNASIKALAPLVLAAGNEEAKMLLASIFVDARVPAVLPADRAAVLAQEIGRIAGGRAVDLVAVIKAALAHNRVAGLAVLRMMHDALVDPQADPELLAIFVNDLAIPGMADAIVGLLPGEGQAAGRAAVTADQMNDARNNKPAEFKIILKNALAIANPTAVAKALDSDPLIKAASKSGIAVCKEALKEQSAAMKVDPNISRLSSEVRKNADEAMVLLNPAVSIAANKMVIGALTRMVNHATENSRNEQQELARVAVIRQMDFDVLAELVVNSSSTLKDAVAAFVPFQVAPAVPNTRDGARAMLNDAVRARIALQAAFTINSAAAANRAAEVLRCRNAGNVIRDLLLAAPNSHGAMERVLGPDPVGALAQVRVPVNLGTVVTDAITLEVTALSAADIREIAQVDLTLCALLMSRVALADPAVRAAPAIPAVRATLTSRGTAAVPAVEEVLRSGLDAPAIAEIAKWVPIIPPVTSLVDTQTRWRDPVRVEAMLRAALIANPVQAQRAIDAAIKLMNDTQLGEMRVTVNTHIAANPSAAIDAQPTVIKARNHFVAAVPAVVAAERALTLARAGARGSESIPASAIGRSKLGSDKVKTAVTALLLNNANIVRLANTIHGGNALLQAVGKHLPLLLNIPWEGRPRSANPPEIMDELRKATPERLTEIFTDSEVIELLAVAPPPPSGALVVDVAQWNRFVDALNHYVAKDEQSIEAAVERASAVMTAKINLELARRAAANGINNAPDVRRARADVVKVSKQRLVQEELYHHLMLGKAFVGQPTLGAIDTMTFRPDGLAAGEPSTMVSADEARDAILQLMQDHVSYLTDLANRQGRLLDHAEKCEDKTSDATKSLVTNIKAAEDLGSVLAVLKCVELTPAEKVRVERAESLLKSLESPSNPIARLFDAAIETKAEAEMSRTKKEVEKLEKELKTFRVNTPARLRALGAAGVVGAVEDAVIPAGLITDQAIIDQRIPDRVAGASSIQKARAQDYIDHINEDEKIQAIRATGGTFAEVAAAIRAEIPYAKTRLFQNEMKGVRADVLALLPRAANSVVATVFAEAKRVGTQGEQPDITSDRALAILQVIASNEPLPRGINLSTTRDQALELLNTIDNDVKVQKALNEACDKQPHSKAAWDKAVDNDDSVKQKVQRIATAKDEAQAAVASHTKIGSQFVSQKEANKNLTAGVDIVEKVNQVEAAEHVEAITQRKERAEEMRVEREEKRGIFGRMMG